MKASYLFPLVILLAVVAGCNGSKSGSTTSANPPPEKSGRTVANMDLQDPKARFLGEGTAYISNLLTGDQVMFEEFVNDNRTAESLVAAIKSHVKVVSRILCK